MIVFVDGSARPTNPGPGGFAIVVCDDRENILYTIYHESKWTTNNKQELAAIVSAVLAFGRREDPLTIYSDSAYAINCLTIWGENWKRNGWTKVDGNIPENLEIVQKYFSLLEQGYRANIRKVKGHSTCRGNQLADLIASRKQKAEVII